MFWVIRSWIWLTWVAAVALGVDGDDLDALLLGVGFDRLLDLVEEVGLQVGDGKAELLGVLGRSHVGQPEQRPRAAAASSSERLISMFVLR